MSDSSYRHILKYTGIFGGVQGLSIIVGLIKNKVIAVLLGPMGMGLATLYNSTVVFMTEATNLGLPTSAVRGVADVYENGTNRELEHHVAIVRAWCFLASILGFFACLLLGPLFSEGSFNYGDHTLNYILLSPAVPFAIITGCETAILKGARCLRQLVWSQIAIMFSALVIAVPVYWIFSYRGVIPVIVFSAFAQMLITMYYSQHRFPINFSGFKGLLRDGRPMLMLGLAFVITGIMGKGAEVFIRYYLNKIDGLDAAGLYNAGYTLAVAYAGMVFTAMETDYYPRLSGCGERIKKQNKLVNRQIEVSMLLVSPMLVALMVALPIVMPLLFSSKFQPIVPMAQVAVLAMFAKGISLPIAYLPLAKSHSHAFVVLEGLYALFLCLAIPFGYMQWGLYGTGIAIVAAHVFDLFIVFVYAFVRYQFRFTATCMRHIVIQCILGTAAYFVIFHYQDLIPYITLSAAVFVLSIAYSAKALLKVRRINK